MQWVSERILLTLWVGGMWTTGYVVAPTLFQMLDRSVAGTVAGQLFSIMSYLGLVCGGLLLTGQIYRYGRAVSRRWPAWLLVLMLAIIVTGEFVIAPEIRMLREAGQVVAQHSRFAMLHGTASILFLISSLSGLALIILGLHGRDGRAGQSG